MPEYISRQLLKKKALERWENEGGKIFAGRTGITESWSPDKSESKDTAAQLSGSPAADKSKGKEKIR